MYICSSVYEVMAVSGWIKLHRQIMQSKLWRSLDADGKVILITLLLRAAHRPFIWSVGKKSVSLGVGELFVSVRSFADELGVTVSGLRSTLKQLVKAEFIEVAADNIGTKVKIVNWPVYQSMGETEDSTYKCAENETQQQEVLVREPAVQKIGEKTGIESGNQTHSDTHNNNYFNNNYNNKNQNSGLKAAIDRYQKNFGLIPTAKLSDFVDIAAAVPEFWLGKALDELIAANRVNRIRVPLAYWSSVLRNWQASGKAEPWQKEEKAAGGMMDFYASKGVNVI